VTDPITITSSALASFNHANNLIKAIFDLKVDSATIDKVVAIQSELASVQNGYLALLQQNTALVSEKDELKKEISRLKTWDHEKQRYQLTNYGDGAALVYSLKESMSNSEPAHWICTNCYEQGKRTILQPASINGFAHLVCPSCKLDIPTGCRGIGPPAYAGP
jgi:hypothetical protein